MENEKVRIPFETVMLKRADHSYTNVTAEIEASSLIGDVSIRDYVSGVNDFLRVYHPILDETITLIGHLVDKSDKPERRLLLLPRGGRIMGVELSSTPDERLLREITFRNGNRAEIEFAFRGVNYAFSLVPS